MGSFAAANAGHALVGAKGAADAMIRTERQANSYPTSIARKLI